MRINPAIQQPVEVATYKLIQKSFLEWGSAASAPGITLLFLASLPCCSAKGSPTLPTYFFSAFCVLLSLQHRRSPTPMEKSAFINQVQPIIPSLLFLLQWEKVLLPRPNSPNLCSEFLPLPSLRNLFHPPAHLCHDLQALLYRIRP